jgi:hypothetical protein
VLKESLQFVVVLLTHVFWIEGAWVDSIVVTISLCSPFEEIVKKINFVV